MWGDCMELKREGEYVRISYNECDVDFHEELIKKGVFVRIKKENLIRLVGQWFSKFINMKNKPEEITFTLHNNGQVTIDTKD